MKPEPNEKIPGNINPLYADKFRLTILNARQTTFFCSAISLPGVSLTDIDIHNPVNKFFVAGNKLNYEPLTVNFRVDEDLTNYRELLYWMKGITGPEDTEQHKEFITSHNHMGGRPSYQNIYNDGSLMALSNVSNANIRLDFVNMFPISLSGLDFDLTNSATIQSSVTFRFDSYDIHVES